MRKDPPKIDWPYVFSVSQLETFRLCPRKWAYLKIDGIEDPGNDASILGGLVHEELEEYLEHGKPINAKSKAGKIAMSGLPHLPPPMYPGMKIEHWFHLRIGGAYYRGLKDVEIEDGWKSDRPLVSDHKTTKAFMWRKMPHDLTGGPKERGDFQAGIYAYHTMEKLGVDEVDLQWTYMRTTGAPLCEPTFAVMTREQAERVIAEVELTTAEMIRTKEENPTAATVVQDPTGCDAFGGCPYRDLCNLTPRQKMKAMVKQVAKENSVLADLAKRKAKKKAEAAEETSAPAEEKKTVETTGETVSEQKETKEAPKDPINPPEKATAPIPTAEDKEPKKKKTSTRTTTTKKAAAPSTGGSIFGRALQAAYEVFAEDLAERITRKIK